MANSPTAGSPLSATVRNARVKVAYLVCMTPRTGSGFLCDTLWETGLFGKPDEYFFDLCYHPEYAVDDDKRDIRRYTRKVLNLGTGPNGVFGAKIMWNHFKELVTTIDTTRQTGTTPDRSILEKFFPAAVKYIWLVRDNKLRQAISLYKRNATGVYSIRGKGEIQTSCAPPSSEQLDELIDWLECCDRQWRLFFDKNAIEPFRIRYESLPKQLTGTVYELTSFLNIDRPLSISVPGSNYQRLSDEVTEKWIEKYRSEKNTPVAS